MSVRASGAQHRGGTLRVLHTLTEDGVRQDRRRLLDPAHGYDGWGTLGLTNDGLLAFRRVGGREASTLVPDLAVSVPAPTDGGRTYAFQLRRGLRYSTGAAVSLRRPPRARARPAHRTGRLAEFYTGDPWRPPLSGARGALRPVRRHPGRRRRGHDHLPADGARPGLPVQAGAAQRCRGRPRRGSSPRGPVPATGPYMVARLSVRGPLRLVRNPRFRPVDGRPDGYPDAITIDCCAATKPGLSAVEQGRADLLGGGFAAPQLATSTRSRPASPASCTPRRWPPRTSPS